MTIGANMNSEPIKQRTKCTDCLAFTKNNNNVNLNFCLRKDEAIPKDAFGCDDGLPKPKGPKDPETQEQIEKMNLLASQHVGQTKKLCDTCHYLSTFGTTSNPTSVYVCLNIGSPGKIIKYPDAATCPHWETKKDSTTDQSIKADAGKEELHLVPFEILKDIAIIRMYGNKKYGDSESWKRVDPVRYIDAMLRHAIAFAQSPQSKDEESGYRHLQHLACNVAFLCEMYKPKGE